MNIVAKDITVQIVLYLSIYMLSLQIRKVITFNT